MLMMHIEWIGLLALVQVISSTATIINQTAMGDTFLVAFPKLQQPEIILAIYTLENKTFLVMIYMTVPGKEDKMLIGKEPVNMTSVSRYSFDPTDSHPSYLPFPPTEYGHHSGLLLTAHHNIGVFVHIFIGQESAGSFMAVPVGAWGRTYYVITLQVSSFFIVLSMHKTKLSFTLRTNPTRQLIIGGRNYLRGDGKARQITMEEYQAFSLIKCVEGRLGVHVSFTGTLISGHRPVGVISGSCYSFQSRKETCKSSDKEMNRDLAVEMLLPLAMYGLEFVIVYSNERKSHDYVTLFTSEANTTVHIFLMDDRKVTPVHLYKAGTVYDYQSFSSHVFKGTIRSNKPISVYSVMISSCLGKDEKGGPSIMQLVPNDLFYNAYVWIRPNDLNVTYYMVLILQKEDDMFTMTWNDTEISARDGEVQYVVNSSYTMTFEKEIPSTMSHGVLQADVPFGCYFLALGYGNGSFMHPAGFVFTYVKEPECEKREQTVGDGIDNDCDGSVDEEFVNDIDDDGDGLKDEDSYNITVTACNIEGHWGKGCQHTCSEYCKEDCMKENGSCISCVAGRQEPRYFCNKDCDPFTYGENCLGDCRKMCDQNDCYERTTGACKPSVFEPTDAPATTVATPLPHPPREVKDEGSSLLLYLLFILVIIAAATAAYIAIIKSQEKPIAVIEERKPSTHVVQERIVVWDEEAIRMKRRRSGSNVDEPDEYNRDYMMKHSAGRFWKYFPLFGSWPAKQEQQQLAPAPAAAMETPQSLTSMMGSAMGQLAADPTAQALTSLVESAVSPLVQVAEPATQTLASLVEAAVGEADTLASSALQEKGAPSNAPANTPAKESTKDADKASSKKPVETSDKESDKPEDKAQAKASSRPLNKPSSKAAAESEINVEESVRSSKDETAAPDLNDFTKVEIDES